MDNEDTKPEGAEGEEEQPKKIEYENLTDEQITECNEIFDECFDKEGNGKLEISELRKLLMWCNFNPTTREVKEFVNTYDPTGSKWISKENCMKIIDSRAGNPDSYEELWEALKHFDKSGSGKIEVPEFRLILASMGEPIDENLVDDVIKELEIDGLINIEHYAKTCFKIPLEDKPAKEKKAGGKKKKK